jgi:serine/threonine protein kinase/tetratricopeptide (TPR) repeat protein
VRSLSSPRDAASGPGGGPALTTPIDPEDATSAPGSPWLGERRDETPLPSGPRPTAIGPYRILDLLGEGGMGIVYRAQQLEPLRRDVALKVVKRGIDTDRVVRRFERERRALARLDHPHIARVIDAGATDDGRPYFVMELVAGRRITAFCDAERLAIDARLAIFLDICGAVRHAHQRGVLHRDLKPSNVLVAQVDGRAVAKVIDFGIAKVMDDTEDHPALDTRLNGQALGTPAYMSPEQAGLLDTGVDTRTDVYSLGVLLYELLTGHHPRDFAPHAPDTTTSGGDRRPSAAVLRTLTSPRGPIDADSLAQRRQSTPQRLRRRLAGDLDTVVLKAIELEPDRRYDSVEQFADDLRRVIAGEPVRAKPPTWSYRARRFVRRHRVSVATASVGVLLMAGAAAVFAWQSVAIARERDRALQAERQASLDARAANQVTDFMVGLFEVASPDKAGGKVVTAREMLDEGAARVRRELTDAPVVRARLLNAMGGAYMGMRQDAAAEALLKDAVAERRQSGAPPGVELFTALQHLSRVRANQDDVPGALAYMDQARAVVDAFERPPGRYHADMLNSVALLQNQSGKYEEALKTLQQALAITLALPAGEPRQEGRIRYNIGGALFDLGRLDEAANAFAEAEASFRLTQSGSRELQSQLVAAQSARGIVLRELGRPADARPILDDGVAQARLVYREPHPMLATIINNLALVEQDLKDYAGAETHFREVLTIDRAVSGARSADVASDLHNLAWFVHKFRGRSAEGEGLSRQAVAMRRDVLGPRHPQTAASMRQLGDILNDRGRPAAALPLYRDALRIQQDVLPRGHRLTLTSMLGLGEALTALGQTAEATRVLEDALQIAREVDPASRQKTALEGALAKARAADHPRPQARR